MAQAVLDETTCDPARNERCGAAAGASSGLSARTEAEFDQAVAWTDLEPSTDRPTVLVVDDEPSIAELLVDVLDSAGYRVLRAANGRTALAIARRERPALVLTDRMMPEVDGVEFTHRLHSSPITRDIPVVLMSSTRPDSGIMGDIPFLAKPFELDDLIHTVEMYTQREH
jgi:CheY-like chemotaxis protein